MNPRFPTRAAVFFLTAFLLFGVLSASFHQHDENDSHHQRSACAVCMLHSGVAHGLTLASLSVPAPLRIISAEAVFFETTLEYLTVRLDSRLSRAPPTFVR